MIHTSPLLNLPGGPLQIAPIPVNARQLELSLVIPTYNERQNLAKLVGQLTALLDEVVPKRYELIVVDDDSPDQTWALAHVLAQSYSQLRVIRRQQERGLSSAVIRGW